jgi:hypothetical protein
MSAEVKNMNKILSQLVADLFNKAKGGADLSSKIHRLRDEIKKIIESGDTLFGKLHELVESFREIIPDEKQRYSAAIKALSTTAKVSRQDIVKAVHKQLEELKILEKGFLSTAFGWRDEFKAMETRSRAMRDEILKLREKLGRLESEEKEILKSMAAHDTDVAFVEKAVRELFRDIAEEITDTNNKLQEIAAESAASQPIPPADPIKKDNHDEEKGGGKQKIEIQGSPAPRDAEWRKQCPMCGGQMNLNDAGKMWQCFSCAFEEMKEEKRDGEQEIEDREPSASQNTEWQKKCSMCGGRMDFYSNEKKWICFACAYEESSEDNVQSKSEEKMEQVTSSHEDKKSKKGTSASYDQPSGKKKACPVCHKKMNWYQNEKAWRCPFCEYERSI